MSGGHWGYAGCRIKDDLENIAEDPEVQRRWPLIAEAIRRFAVWIDRTEYGMDRDLSGDIGIEDDGAFERERMKALRSPGGGRCR